jgi:polyvinyl alcohol dehydrogenase (cytochrome)
MKGRRQFTVVSIAWLVLAAAPLTPAWGQALQGLPLFELHCAACHGAAPGEARAPTRDVLRDMTPQRVLDAMTTGSMSEAAKALSETQKRGLAEFLTGRPIGSDTAGAASAMKNRCAATPLGNPLQGPAWNGWGAGVTNHRFQTAAAGGLDPVSVPKLQLKWAFGIPQGRSAFGQPTVVGGRVYIGTDTGFLYSIDAATGCVHWSFSAPAGIRSAVTIGPIAAAGVRYAAFFGDLKSNVFAVNADTGAVVWTARADGHPLARITGAPTLHEGRLYVPVSSLEEGVGAVPGYQCCTFRGSVVAYDANDGRQIWKTYTIPNAAVPTRKTSTGTQLWGPAGAAVWASPTVDAARKRLYISTSNGYTYPAAPTTNSVIALDLATGERIWHSQLTPDDAFIVGCGPKTRVTNENCPQEVGPDFAVGTSPILVTVADGREMIVVGQKSGLAWGLDPSANGVMRWQHRVGRGTELGGIEWGGAVEGDVAFYPNADARYGPEEAGGLAAIRIATGERVWFTRPPRRLCGASPCLQAQSAAASAIPGVVFSGDTTGMLRAYDSKSGQIIWEYLTAREFETVNGVAARGGSINGPGPTIVNGMLFTMSGYAYLGFGLPGNVLLAFGVK